MQSYNLVLSENELQVVLNALGELPAKASLGVILSIQGQLQEKAQKKGPDEFSMPQDGGD